MVSFVQARSLSPKADSLMADTIIRVKNNLAGFSSPKIKVFAAGGSAAALNNSGNGDDLSAVANHSGEFQATISEALSGFYPYEIVDGSVLVADGWLYLQDDTSTYYGQRSHAEAMLYKQMLAVGSETIAHTGNADNFKANVASLSGANTVVITVDDGTDPLESARVRVTKGALTDVRQTDASGEASFALDDGTWTVAITLAGYTFASTTIVVDGDETATYSMTLTVPTPVASPWVNAQIQCYDEAGNAESSATITVTQIEASSVHGSASEAGPRTITANGSGVAVIPVLPGAKYQFSYQDGSQRFTETIPTTAEDEYLIRSIYG
jgi:hypothetical protein